MLTARTSPKSPGSNKTHQILDRSRILGQFPNNLKSRQSAILELGNKGFLISFNRHIRRVGMKEVNLNKTLIQRMKDWNKAFPLYILLNSLLSCCLQSLNID